MLGTTILYAFLLFQQSGLSTASPKPHDSPTKMVTFDNDSRLKVTTSLQKSEVRHDVLWGHIMRQAKVTIEREEAAREFDNSPLTMCCNNVSIHDLMDAVAARILARWEKIPKGYRFLVSSNELDTVYKPKSPKQRDFFRQGMEFVGRMKNLPDDQQRSLETGAPYSSLPPAMQNFAHEIVRSFVQDMLENQPPGSQAEFASDDYSNATMRVQKQSVQGFDMYAISLSKPGGGGSWSVNNYEQKMAAGGQAGTSADKSKVYVPKKYEVTHDNALKTPLLKQLVSLRMRNVSLPQALRKLNEKYSLNFVSDPPTEFPQTATIEFTNRPLGELLDRLTELYPHTEWELRKSNILLYRCAKNSIHDPSTAQDEILYVPPPP